MEGKVDTEMWMKDRTSWRESKIWLKNTERIISKEYELWNAAEKLFEGIMQLQQCSKRL